MKISKLIIILSCFLTAFACSAAKYQIKVLNTPTITIDNRQAKVGDWFTDESVIVWSRDNQAMRVVSDENKVYTLSAKLYKEANAKKFSDFILYTKPLAARGTNDLDLIEQLAERFDNTFVMLDEIVIDLSDVRLSESCCFHIKYDNNKLVKEDNTEGHIVYPINKKVKISRQNLGLENNSENGIHVFTVLYFLDSGQSNIITDSFFIEFVPISIN